MAFEEKNPSANAGTSARREALLFVGYFVIYALTLFWSIESELVHWLTLVLIPFTIILVLRRRSQAPVTESLGSVGIRRDSWRTGLWWAFLTGFALSVLQLFVSSRWPAFWELVTSAKVLYLAPLAFVLLIFTAGFTEEFFFRGVVQTRLAEFAGSRILAIAGTSIMFGLYHLPYAYMNPRWPSYGDWYAAFGASMGQGVIGGIILGVVYERSGKNLFAPVVVHTLINLFPAMTMIKFGAG